MGCDVNVNPRRTLSSNVTNINTPIRAHSTQISINIIFTMCNNVD